MPNTEKRYFSPEDIEIALSEDYGVTRLILRNWVKPENNFFNTPLEEPRAGHSRKFPLSAVYEAAFLKIHSNCGMSLHAAKEQALTFLQDIEGENEFSLYVFRPKNNKAAFFRDDRILAKDIFTVFENASGVACTDLVFVDLKSLKDKIKKSLYEVSPDAKWLGEDIASDEKRKVISLFQNGDITKEEAERHIANIDNKYSKAKSHE